MSSVRKTGERGVQYRVIDRLCIGRSCFAPGMYQHRGATMSGSRNTGSPDTPCCLNNAYHGCPHPLPEPTTEQKRARAKEGWKNA